MGNSSSCDCSAFFNSSDAEYHPVTEINPEVNNNVTNQLHSSHENSTVTIEKKNYETTPEFKHQSHQQKDENSNSDTTASTSTATPTSTTSATSKHSLTLTLDGEDPNEHLFTTPESLNTTKNGTTQDLNQTNDSSLSVGKLVKVFEEFGSVGKNSSSHSTQQKSGKAHNNPVDLKQVLEIDHQEELNELKEEFDVEVGLLQGKIGERDIETSVKPTTTAEEQETNTTENEENTSGLKEETTEENEDFDDFEHSRFEDTEELKNQNLTPTQSNKDQQIATPTTDTTNTRTPPIGKQTSTEPKDELLNPAEEVKTPNLYEHAYPTPGQEGFKPEAEGFNGKRQQGFDLKDHSEKDFVSPCYSTMSGFGTPLTQAKQRNDELCGDDGLERAVVGLSTPTIETKVSETNEKLELSGFEESPEQTPVSKSKTIIEEPLKGSTSLVQGSGFDLTPEQKGEKEVKVEKSGFCDLTSPTPKKEGSNEIIDLMSPEGNLKGSSSLTNNGFELSPPTEGIKSKNGQKSTNKKKRRQKKKGKK